MSVHLVIRDRKNGGWRWACRRTGDLSGASLTLAIVTCKACKATDAWRERVRSALERKRKHAA